jgi:hypothetical protein
MDEKNPAWLHLCIRSPHQPLGEVGTGGYARSSGQWTLAFEDAKSCKNASLFLKQQIFTQTNNVKIIIISPFSVKVLKSF